jgi:hypothetical protein
MVTTLPYVGAAVVVKIALRHGLGFEGVVDFSDLGPLFTGGVFLIGFMLAGTLSDYKESEKIPAELACGLETIEETFAQASVGRPAVNLPAARATLAALGTTVDDWLHRRVPQERVFAALSELQRCAEAVERAGASGYAGRALNELHVVRKLVTRIGVISRTGFLASGYAILETISTVIVALLMVARFHNVLAEATLVAFVTLVFAYMVRLIRDVDDPFEYADDGKSGSAEVELFPLGEYRARLAARLAESPVSDRSIG